MRVAAILSCDKCLYLRLTTARLLSAYMSSRALATTTTSSFCCSRTLAHTTLDGLSTFSVQLVISFLSRYPRQNYFWIGSHHICISGIPIGDIADIMHRSTPLNRPFRKREKNRSNLSATCPATRDMITAVLWPLYLRPV